MGISKSQKKTFSLSAENPKIPHFGRIPSNSPQRSVDPPRKNSSVYLESLLFYFFLTLLAKIPTTQFSHGQ